MYHRPMDAPSTDVTAFILAGGKSTRMGTDKAFVMLDGRTLLVARAWIWPRSVTSEVRIVGDPAKFAAFAPTVEDIFPRLRPARRNSRGPACLADGTELDPRRGRPVRLASAAAVPDRAGAQYDRSHGDSAAGRPSVGSHCARFTARAFAERAEKALQKGDTKLMLSSQAATRRRSPKKSWKAQVFLRQCFAI